MKTKILLFLAAASLMASCSKDKKVIPVTTNEDYFAFGYQDAVCVTCNSIHPTSMAFLLKNTDVYPLKDSLKTVGHYDNFSDNNNFLPTGVGGNAFTISNNLKNEFPSYLLNSADSVYGIPVPVFGYLVLAVKTNGVVRHWKVAMDTTMLPAQIRPFIGHVISSIDTLYPPFQSMVH